MSGAALIMIGAGEAQDLPADWQRTYDRLILIEPIPELAADLRDRFSGMEPVETIEATVVGDSDGAEITTLQVFSWQALSSRYAPAELLNLFPGLEVDRALRVRAVTLSELLETCQLEADADNGLMIDAPGEGLPIVQSLIEGEWREAFTRLSVREPAQWLYYTTSGPDPIADALKAAGFSQDATDTQDPEWPSLTFTRNRWKLRSERLAGDVERLTAELAERDQRIHLLTSELDVHTKALDQRAAERDSAQDEVEEAKRTAEAEAQQREAAEARVAEIAETLEIRTSERDQQAAQATELEARLQAKEAEIRVQTAENPGLQRLQTLVNEDLSNAEARVALLKDLLFQRNEL